MSHNFFLQPLESTPPAQPGQRRVAKRFDIKFNTLADSTIDILFSKQVRSIFNPSDQSFIPTSAERDACSSHEHRARQFL